MEYLYHFKRPSMVGDVLYPLNELRGIHPELFKDHAKKYDGREVLMEREIPSLNCLWNDVIHFSPIHPQRIIDTWKKHQFPTPKSEIPVFKIPVDALKEKDLVYFDPHAQEYGNYHFTANHIRAFETRKYKEQQAVSDIQLDAWKNDREAGCRLFWFSHTTHVLFKGSVDISEIEVVQCR